MALFLPHLVVLQVQFADGGVLVQQLCEGAGARVANRVAGEIQRVQGLRVGERADERLQLLVVNQAERGNGESEEERERG